MNIDVLCEECSAVVYEHDLNTPVDRLDGRPCDCIECSAKGHLSVEQEDGDTRLEWRKNR